MISGKLLSPIFKGYTQSIKGNFANSNVIRTFCAASLQNTEDIVEKSSVDAYKNMRDVPFLFLPHTARKAYHVHETSLTIPKIFEKYKWLTKTISSPGIPSHHVTSSKNEEENSELLKGFYDSLLQTIAFQKSYKRTNNPRFIPERINFSILSNFLRLSMAFDENLVHLNPENSFLYHQPLLETHWPRNYKFYQTKFRPTFVLRTKNGFEMIEEPRALTREEVTRLPGPYDPYDINLYRQGITHLRNQPAMDNSKFNPIKHCHTSIMVHSKMQHTEQFLSLGLFTMFAQLIAQAQGAGVLHGTDLKEPLVSQCVATNGHRSVFMVYQLNTLNMLDDKGVWNRCWYSPLMEMYSRREDPPNYMVYEEMDTSGVLNGFNEEGCRYFINFIRKETV